MGGTVIGYLGIDIGGTKVALRITGADEVSAHEATFRWTGTDDVVRDLDDLASQVVGLRRQSDERIDAVGVAMPATLDASGKVLTWPNRPAWTGLDVEEALGALFDEAPVRCADDGDLAALAEAHHAGCDNLVYLGVGTGIGGGVVIGGRSCPGLDRGSCEVGHTIVDRAGPLCDCRRRGCVQAIASGPATLRRAAALRGHDVTFAEVGEALTAGRSWAVSAVDESCAALAATVTSLSELVHPEQAIIGGGFAAGMPGFVSRVAAHTRALARPGHPAVDVRPAGLAGLSSLHGAVLLARSLA